MKQVKKILFMVMVLFCTLCNAVAQTKTSTEVLETIERVNDFWQTQHAPTQWAFWDYAAYYTGNMEVYKLTGKARFLEYSDRWCRHNEWKGARSNDKKNWKYKTYGEGHDFVLFGDWQICFQTYLDMYTMNPDAYKIERTIEVMNHMCAMPETDFWWWADALYMVMPVLTKLYTITGNENYLDKLYDCFVYSDSLLYDPEMKLYYRDAKYIYPKVKTVTGGKSFWARGDGWVMAGLAKVLADMPKDYKHYPLFLQRFKELAEGVAACQQNEGYWSRSMLCEADAPGYETSGTAFFTYGFLWGVNNGILDKNSYADVIDKAWNYLFTKALQNDYSIGFVQPIGEKPDPTRHVNATSQAPFGTGAWLLAACEMVRYMDRSVNATSPQVTVEITNSLKQQRYEVVEIEAAPLFEKLGIGGGRQFVVLDARNREVVSQLTHDGKLLIQASVNNRHVTRFTIAKGMPKLYKNSAYGRMYPERMDDIAWENDLTAYRCYGPALQVTGEKAFGIDVWTKSTPDLVVEKRYQKELAAKPRIRELIRQNRQAEARTYQDNNSYHIDHGDGLDCYSVGPSLGCGAPAFWVDKKMIMPYAWSSYELLDNGPLRFKVKLTYKPSAIGDDTQVIETRTVSLDKGSHLNKMEVSYQNCTQQQVVSGVVLHQGESEVTISKGKERYIAYADPTDGQAYHNYQIYTGCLFPNKVTEFKRVMLDAPVNGILGHAIGITSYTSGETFTYYAGSAWSKYAIPNLDAWCNYLQQFSHNLATPLVVKVK